MSMSTNNFVCLPSISKPYIKNNSWFIDYVDLNLHCWEIKGKLTKAPRQKERNVLQFLLPTGAVKRYYLCEFCSTTQWIDYRNYSCQHIRRHHPDQCELCNVCNQLVLKGTYYSHKYYCSALRRKFVSKASSKYNKALNETSGNEMLKENIYNNKKKNDYTVLNDDYINKADEFGNENIITNDSAYANFANNSKYLAKITTSNTNSTEIHSSFLSYYPDENDLKIYKEYNNGYNDEDFMHGIDKLNMNCYNSANMNMNIMNNDNNDSLSKNLNDNKNIYVSNNQTSTNKCSVAYEPNFSNLVYFEDLNADIYKYFEANENSDIVDSYNITGFVM